MWLELEFPVGFRDFMFLPVEWRVRVGSDPRGGTPFVVHRHFRALFEEPCVEALPETNLVLAKSMRTRRLFLWATSIFHNELRIDAAFDGKEYIPTVNTYRDTFDKMMKRYRDFQPSMTISHCLSAP